MAIDRVVSKGIKGGYVTAIFSAGGYIAKGSSNAVVAANSAGETVQEMFISDVFWGIGGANNVSFTIARGANTVLVVSGPGSGHWNFPENGIAVETGGESAANCVVTRSGTGPATVVIKLHKRTAITGGSQY